MKASVIIINCNYQEYLPAAIESALSQSYPPAEIIVADDGSTDQSREIIASYGRRLTPIFKPTNAGQSSAFNAGFQVSSEDVVVFLDADDLLYQHALGKISTILSENPETVRLQ